MSVEDASPHYATSVAAAATVGPTRLETGAAFPDAVSSTETSMAKATEEPLQLLAEIELLRRKSTLLERRVAAWENELLEVRESIDALQRARDPESPEWQEKLSGLDHRVGRLERRREAEAAAPPPSSAAALGARHTVPRDLDSVALVRARWVPSDATPGETVDLVATADGIPADTKLTFTVRSLVEDAPVAELTGTCDGDVAQASWKVPKKPPFRELVFEVRHEGAEARSPVLVLPAD